MRPRLGIGLAFLPLALGAQGLRISGVTTMQLIELRPFVIDSAPASSFGGTGEWRTTPEGVPVVCPATSSFCQFERSGDLVRAAPLLQDLTIAGWGLMQGLSVHADLRARTQVGDNSAFVFPRFDDHFDVLDAYAQLDRSAWQARLGRQWITSGLGAYDFDGANALVRRSAFALEGWAGRALVAGLAEPYTSAELAAADNLPPSRNGYVFGARGRFRPDALTAAALTYQRTLIADRSGLYSERAALDASDRRLGAALDLALTYDLATNAFNEARFRVGTPGTRALDASAEVRHSRPFFELWTIWGAFAPIGFDEGRATIDWRPRSAPMTVALRGAYRKYAQTNAGFTLRTNGWRAGGDISWFSTSTFVASGSYDVDIGSGAANTDIRGGLRWIPSSALTVGAQGVVTQNIYEFRVGTGRIYGLIVDASALVAPDVRLVVDAGLYRHSLTNGAVGPDWTQQRAAVRLEWTLGRDPGMRDRGQ